MSKPKEKRKRDENETHASEAKQVKNWHMNDQANPAQELKQLNQTQLNLFLNVNLTLKRDIEEYLNKKEKILEANGEIREEVVKELVAMFMEFAKNIILDQERTRKVKTKGKITARDLDDQLHQANLYNWWSGKQIDLYYKLKRLYHLQRAKEYEEE